MLRYISYIKSTGLIVIGALLGVAGISLNSGVDAKDLVTAQKPLVTLEQVENRLASADFCSDPDSLTEEEIFFLSCGGIY